MKNFTLFPTMLFLFFFSNMSFAQLIEAEKLSVDFLKETFENANITILSSNNNYFKTRDTHDFYVALDDEKRFVSFTGMFKLADGTSKQKVLDFVNEINNIAIMIKVAYKESDHSIWMYYYFWTEEGFTVQSMLKSYGVMKVAAQLLSERDTEKIIE